MKRRGFLKLAPIGAIASVIAPQLLLKSKEDKLILKLDDEIIATTTSFELAEDDWQYLESRKISVEEIVRVYNVPIEILGTETRIIIPPPKNGKYKYTLL